MKKSILVFAISFITSIGMVAQDQPTKEYENRYQDIMRRTQWWREARFGMFIHFGAYAVPARGEWVKSNEKLTTKEYQRYVDEFNPINFDANQWAKTAKAAGMKYAVLTAKHHDGFCLFDSKLTDYKLSRQFNGRDLVREFLDAFRAEGLKVGLYYSIIDWHHSDYPNVGNHPQRDDKKFMEGKNLNWDNYIRYMHGQIEELVKNYGKIDILWFDYSFDDYNGEKWKANDLVKMIRKYQPEVIMDNRLELHGGSSTKERSISFTGDFETPEQGIPDAQLIDKYGHLLPWETCLTLNRSWGYNENDHNWKSPELIIHSLVNCVSKNGNLLLNVGPDARGRIPEKSIEILSEVGQWMEKNGESIYGCGSSNLSKPDWGRYTQNGNKLYVHWLYPFIGDINAKGLDAQKVSMVTMLQTGAEVQTYSTWWGNSDAGNFFIKASSSPQMPYKYDSVVKIQLK